MTTAIAQALSAALLHFVWQGLIVAFVLWVALFVLRKRSAHSRYLASCLALAILAVLPAITAYVLYDRPATVRTAEPPAAAPQTIAAEGRGAASPQVWLAAWQSWAVPVWSLGVLLFSMRLAWGCKQVSSLRRRGTPAEAPVLATVASLAARLGLTRRVYVLITSVADGPSVVGWIRPVVLLPSATLLGLTPEQLETVLAHELAHIRRHDYLVNVLQILVETLLFYHPAVWWMSARIRQERELCCDDLAVSACGDALCYARALTRLERLRVSAPDLAMASTGGPLLYRIQRLIGARTQEYGPSKLPGILALSLGLACFAVNVHWARGQSQAERKPGEYVFLGLAHTFEKDGAGVMVDLGGATVLRRPSVEYPGSAMEKSIQGTVTVEVTLDASGDVGDVRVLSGPPELRRVVLQSVLEWRFQPGTAGTLRQVSVTFNSAEAQKHAAEERPQTVTSLDKGSYTISTGGRQRTVMVRPNPELTAEPGVLTIEPSGAREGIQRLEDQMRQLEEKLAEAQQDPPTPASRQEVTTNFLKDQVQQVRARIMEREAELSALAESTSPPVSAVGHRLARIDPKGFSDDVRQAILSRLPVHVGDTLSQQSIEQIAAALRSFDNLEFKIAWRLVETEGEDFTLRIRSF